MSWFQKQMTEISEVHTEITWQEALDNAVLKIHEIKDIESETGKRQLGAVIEGLKFQQAKHKSYMERLAKDREASKDIEAAESQIFAQPMHYLLPWEVSANSTQLRPDQITQITKEVFALAADESALMLSLEDQLYEFQFNMDCYVILAQIMIKFDRNLQKVRQQCVPDLIEEEDFWRNYFYKIECIKASLGLPNNLGPFIEPETRRKMKEQATRQDPPKKPAPKQVEIELKSMSAKPQTVQEQKVVVNEEDFEVEI